MVENCWRSSILVLAITIGSGWMTKRFVGGIKYISTNDPQASCLCTTVAGDFRLTRPETRLNMHHVREFECRNEMYVHFESKTPKYNNDSIFALNIYSINRYNVKWKQRSEGRQNNAILRRILVRFRFKWRYIAYDKNNNRDNDR